MTAQLLVSIYSSPGYLYTTAENTAFALLLPIQISPSDLTLTENIAMIIAAVVYYCSAIRTIRFCCVLHCTGRSHA